MTTKLIQINVPPACNCPVVAPALWSPLTAPRWAAGPSAPPGWASSPPVASAPRSPPPPAAASPNTWRWPSPSAWLRPRPRSLSSLRLWRTRARGRRRTRISSSSPLSACCDPGQPGGSRPPAPAAEPEPARWAWTLPSRTSSTGPLVSAPVLGFWWHPERILSPLRTPQRRASPELRLAWRDPPTPRRSRDLLLSWEAGKWNVNPPYC